MITLLATFVTAFALLGAPTFNVVNTIPGTDNSQQALHDRNIPQSAAEVNQLQEVLSGDLINYAVQQ